MNIKCKVHPNDDLWCALKNHPEVSLKEGKITDIVAEVCGANDEDDWWWIIKYGNQYILLQGGCDYTGWDCQSHLVEHGAFKTALQAAKLAPEKEEYTGRTIRKNLVGQIKKTQPKYLYISGGINERP